MHAWEESSSTGTTRRSNRDFDDFDELDDDELGTDEENEFAVRYLDDADDDLDESADDDELYESKVENVRPGS